MISGRQISRESQVLGTPEQMPWGIWASRSERLSKTRSTIESMPQEFMDTYQVARYLKCSVYTVARYRKGQGVKTPLPFIRLNPRRIVYERKAVRRWLLNREIKNDPCRV